MRGPVVRASSEIPCRDPGKPAAASARQSSRGARSFRGAYSSASSGCVSDRLSFSLSDLYAVRGIAVHSRSLWNYAGRQRLAFFLFG